MVETNPHRESLEKALGERFKILRLLGQGGMGSVYLAREEALERLVAIKVLRLDQDQSPEGRERFRREARTAARLTHPHVVPLHSFGEVDGLLYLVMGYVRGETLAARLRRETRIATDETRRIIAGVAEALDYAHRHGVVHRDVKPDNILLEDETGRALLTDFGIAKGAGAANLTQTGGVVGTPLYMSPEQAAGEETLDGRSDIYSLGLVAYAMLAGRAPYEGQTPRDVILKRLASEPPTLRAAAPGAPDDLAAAIARCLQREPAQRWPDARSLREAVAPTTLEEEQLPEPLDTLDGAAPLLLAGFFLMADVLLSVAVARRPNVLQALLLVLLGGMVAFQLPILFSALRLARRRGFSFRQILGAFLRQPAWWACLWYPRPFRRAGDMWERLPPPFRWWRLSVSLAVANLALAVPAFVLATGDRVSSTLVFRLVNAAFVLVVVVYGIAVTGLAVSAFFGARLLRSRGLDTYSLRRVARTLLNGPTSAKAAWRKPGVVEVLLPPPALAPTRRAPASPRECFRAISEGVAALAGVAREAGTEAVNAARRALAAIEALDGEIARLGREAEPTEQVKLRERLAGLAGATDVESREMSELLSRQLGLVERLTARLEAARSQREQLWNGLRDLWSAVVDPAPPRPDRIQVLCAHLEARTDPESDPTLAR